MKKLRVVLIGAGSASFGRTTVEDLIACEEFEELNLTVTLVDLDKVALDRVYQFANLLKKHHNSKVRIEATIDRKQALRGANYVIISVAQKRSQLWEKDFYIPAAYGFRHVLGENGGPGAAFHTLRSLQLVVPIAKDMDKLCPDALLINFTNPESRVCLAIAKLTRIRAVGLCHGPFETLKVAAKVLGRSEEDIDMTVGGINHFHWALQIRERSSGKDLYPEFDLKMKQTNCHLVPFVARMYELFGLLTYPTSSHPGEYVSFAHEISGPVFLKSGVGEVSRRLQPKVPEQGYSLEDRSTQPRELAIPIICDIEFNRNQKEFSVNLPNKNLAISNLPEDAIVETPARVDADGVHAIKVGALPEAIAALCNNQISIQRLLVEAYRHKSKKLLLHALIIDPIVDSLDRAEKMMDHMLKVQADYLPELH